MIELQIRKVSYAYYHFYKDLLDAFNFASYKKSAMQQFITRGADWLEIIGAWANACVTNPHDFLEVKILYFAFNVVRMLSIATLSSCDLLCSCFDILT